ncbi:hypothetical protein CALVIDRAFT_61113 [Calocera viscosa TUFC12733]|uniref:Uncharacterized protein n=1 Tax=Calocera viscosa (strain TUFC12733) TaxID=1330018 RepID=A0A167NLC0_CALVF|nr:hypothetical protein CALVIDRAFT_61113 [Calocera viscosa TUFC12733]
MSTVEKHQKPKQAGIGTACVGHPCASIRGETSEDVPEILGATDTAPTTSASAPELVIDPHTNQSPTDTNQTFHYSTDEQIARTQRALDEAETMYRNLEPVSHVHAVQIECRLASIAILRRAVQVQDEQENGSAPPPYDPAWRETSNTARNPAISGSPSPSLSSLHPVTPSTPPAAPCTEPTHHPEFSCNMRVYNDAQARQVYREARREAFLRYREEHGLTTWRARVSSWWNNLYGGLTLEEIKAEYRAPAS